MKTAQRVSAVDPSDGFVLARSVLAYRRAAEIVRGDVLEIGTGTGYGVEILAPRCRSLTTVDKLRARAKEAANFRRVESTGDCSRCRGEDGNQILNFRGRTPEPVEEGAEGRRRWSEAGNVAFRRMTVPPLDFADGSFDCVVSFQVIEHVARDRELIKEIARVLRPGGRLIISTPNRRMSLTRNPWHVREYTPAEFAELLERDFQSVETLGVFGDERVMEYYGRNRAGVRRWTRWDVLRLRDWLPRWLLRAPYDVANRLNRRALAAGGEGFRADDYRIAPVNDAAFDLFYVAEKR